MTNTPQAAPSEADERQRFEAAHLSASPVAEVRLDVRSEKMYIATIGDADLQIGDKLYATPRGSEALLHRALAVAREYTRQNPMRETVSGTHDPMGAHALVKLIESALAASQAAPPVSEAQPAPTAAQEQR